MNKASGHNSRLDSGQLLFTRLRSSYPLHSFRDHGKAVRGLAKHNQAIDVQISEEDSRAGYKSDRGATRLWRLSWGDSDTRKFMRHRARTGAMLVVEVNIGNFDKPLIWRCRV